MFSLYQNRVYTEKPFFVPTYELFKRFYKEYFISHPSLKKLKNFEIGICGRFMRDSTWDIDVRLLGKTNPNQYELISDFFRDITDIGLNKYRLFIDIHCLETPNSIKSYNSSFNSGSEYLYISKYVDHLKQYVNYNKKYFKTTDYTKNKYTKVSDNLWRIENYLDLKDLLKRKNYINNRVPHMIEISKHKELI